MPKYEYGWFATYNKLDGWLIKTENTFETPVCQIKEPQGGNKNAHGRNAYTEENVNVIVAAPMLLAACKVALDYVTPEEPAFDVLNAAILKATEP